MALHILGQMMTPLSYGTKVGHALQTGKTRLVKGAKIEKLDFCENCQKPNQNQVPKFASLKNFRSMWPTVVTLTFVVILFVS